ncbi:hypothetical protein GCM10025791_07160 [Halioxenophilus aromaticivorans]|uniref:Uncharacterized protein n=1 Tax=Halioxenophilus aromaticivorans TaxID=1306992 RepID=A0AAV3TYN4_9ALTE
MLFHTPTVHHLSTYYRDTYDPLLTYYQDTYYQDTHVCSHICSAYWLSRHPYLSNLTAALAQTNQNLGDTTNALIKF